MNCFSKKDDLKAGKTTEFEFGQVVVTIAEVNSLAGCQIEIMYEILLRSHSGLRWVVLIPLVLGSIGRALTNMSSGKFTALDDKLSLFSLYLHTSSYCFDSDFLFHQSVCESSHGNWNGRSHERFRNAFFGCGTPTGMLHR